MNQTEPESITIANKFFRDAAKKLDYLAARWQDEQEYEDINDYADALRPIAHANGVMQFTMTKRPFGVKFTLDGTDYIIKCNRTRITLTYRSRR